MAKPPPDLGRYFLWAMLAMFALAMLIHAAEKLWK